jgi:hypothetical protein
MFGLKNSCILRLLEWYLKYTSISFRCSSMIYFWLEAGSKELFTEYDVYLF